MVITSIIPQKRFARQALAALILLFAACSTVNSYAGSNTRTVSVRPSASQVNVRGSASYIATISKRNASASTTVNYSMSGTAVRGTDYTLSGTYGKIVIPKNGLTSSVTITGPAVATNTGTKVATMTILNGSGYNTGTPKTASILVSTAGAAPTPTPTPTPSPPPSPTPTPSPSATPVPPPGTEPTHRVWISIRTDGHSGTGTQADPYDGSTQAKFDAVMSSLQYTPSLEVNLGTGTFRTSVTKPWTINSGWWLLGAGMYNTTIQLTGNVHGMHYNVPCLSSNPNMSRDYIVVRDLTCDANWNELSQTADTGASNEKNINVSALVIWGSNNLIQRVRSINTYGSWANAQEQFAIMLGSSRFGSGTNDIIDSCVAESPKGTYGNPFALSGWGSYVITNSKVVSSTGRGLNNGANGGFNSGGVNLAGVKDCVIDGNTFIDCSGAAYQDTGSVDGLRITNNTVVRCWLGVGLVSPTLPKQNVVISGNWFSIQNRGANEGSYGMGTGHATMTNITLDRNTVTIDASGNGFLQFWGISAVSVSTATISNNTVDPSLNVTSGSPINMWGNRHPDGSIIPGLGN